MNEFVRCFSFPVIILLETRRISSSSSRILLAIVDDLKAVWFLFVLISLFFSKLELNFYFAFKLVEVFLACFNLVYSV